MIEKHPDILLLKQFIMTKLFPISLALLQFMHYITYRVTITPNIQGFNNSGM